MRFFYTALLMAFCACVPAKQLPIEAFSKHGDYLNMKLSPDGKHIMARARVDERVVLIFFDASTMKVVGGMKPPSQDIIHSAEWINNQRVVFQFAEKQFGFDRPVATGELFGVNIDGSSNRMLFGYRAGDEKAGSRISNKKDTKASAEIISYLPEDDKHILIAEYPFTVKGNLLYDDRKKKPSVSLLNVYSGRKRRVEIIPFPGATVFASDSGDINFVRWRSEEGGIKTAYRPDEDSEWQEFSDINVDDFSPIAVNKTGDKLYGWGDYGSGEFDTVFEVDIASNEAKPLFKNLESNIERLNWDPALDMPTVGMSLKGKIDYHYASRDEQKVESRTAKYHKALVEAFGGQAVSISSQSDDGKLLLIHVTSDINPGEYYIFNTESNGAQFLWANRSWLDPRTLANTEAISFTASDGLPINGYLTLPKGFDEKAGAPLVVVNHGGPHQPDTQDTWFFDTERQLLANNGYAVLQINFRGSYGYGDKFVRAGYKEWGGLMIQDIIEGTQYVLDNYPIDKQKVCTYGASYGGYASLMLTVNDPETFKCAIGNVGPYDLNFAYSKSDIVDSIGGQSYLERVIGTDKAALDSFSPVNHADKIKANIMLIHGNKDRRVSVENAEKMKEKLEAQGKKVKYINFVRAGHGVYGQEERKEQYESMLAFLAENLK